MDQNQLQNEGGNKVAENTASTEPVVTEPAEVTENPAVNETDTAKSTEGTSVPAEPAKEMTAEQFELYNETLRRVSKTAKADLQSRYNAFEDTDVKALVKQQILAGEKPDIGGIATGVVTRLAPKVEEQTEESKTQKAKTDDDEVTSLKAEVALMKAGITPERLDAAKHLFLLEGGDPEKVSEFVNKYPEWKTGGNDAGVIFSKAPPVAGKTAPQTNPHQPLNEFERKVEAARKARGLI